MDQAISDLTHILQRHIGLHRQLMELVRLEREAYVGMDLKQIHENTCGKQALLENIRQVEAERLKVVKVLAAQLARDAETLTLTYVIHDIQAKDLKAADQLRSLLNTLTIMVERISIQNTENERLLLASLDHVKQMKRNVLGESPTNGGVYNPAGQRQVTTPASRFISQEI